MTDKRLIGRRQAANYLGLREAMVYRLVRSGDLPALKVGRVLKFDTAELDQWRERRRANAPEAEPDRLPTLEVDITDAADRSFGERALAALLAEQRETRRALVRLSNRLAGGSR